MHTVVIGGTGHVGTYLVPRLVEAGHRVTVVSRGQREPYTPHGAWCTVKRVTLDRVAEEAAGTFGAKIRDLKPDVVVDMICFYPGERPAPGGGLARYGGAFPPLQYRVGAWEDHHGPRYRGPAPATHR